MLRSIIYALKKADWPLYLVVIFLVALGIVGIYSVEVTADQPTYTLVIRQSIFAIAGCLLMIAFSVIDYRRLRGWTWVLYGASIMLLLGVLLFGTTIRGTKGWFMLYGDLGFQPVELIKVFVIILLGKLLYDWRGEIASARKLLYLVGLIGVLIGLVLAQPDFGSSFIIAATVLGLLVIVKMPRRYLAWIGVFLLIIMVVGWQFVLRDYQKERILTFIDPDRDPYGSGYNIKQSIIAVGSGNFLGRGLALGPQSRLNFLPVQETDFIYAVIAEQLGFVGASLILGLCVALVYRLIRIARRARDDFGLFMIMGTVIYFMFQALMNIGMNIGLLPIAGVPLPLVSYGGSSLVVSLLLIGLAQSVQIHNTGATSTRAD
ncbi:MAG: rod shape-determining protein RodA [Candidatus Kerfeldbacteria bacterium]|nr:rod shape-determining protein RodA [Candidatus Kerfeldbacteria bacterium]